MSSTFLAAAWTVVWKCFLLASGVVKAYAPFFWSNLTCRIQRHHKYPYILEFLVSAF